jgi:hypothetical protein
LIVTGGILIAIGEKLKERCVLITPQRHRVRSPRY